MRVLHPEDLLQLAADRGRLRLSLFLPTNRHEPARSGNQARWANLVRGAKEAMRATGTSAALVRQVLDGPLDLLAETWPWERPDNGLAMFAEPGKSRCYWLPRLVPALATFGDRFTICPLFPMLSGRNEDRALAAYRVLSCGGRTVTDPAELLTAAKRGCVDTLFVSTDVTPRPRRAGDHLVTKLDECPITALRAGTVAEAVLRQGARVLSLPAGRMPEQVPMAATLRRSALPPWRNTKTEVSSS